MRVEPKTLPGFMELLPKDQIKFNQMKDKIQKSYEKYGFLPLDTPVVESAEVLLAKAGGETEKQIYKFTKGDNELALRFDLTVPLAKYVAQNYNNLSFPFRRYQIGKVYRGERPQKGRFREFYQCDIDIVGDNELNILNDAEIVSIIYNTINSLGFDKFIIRINNRKLLNGLFKEIKEEEKSVDIMRIIDKIDKVGKDKIVELLKEINVNEEKIEKIISFILIDGNNEEKIEKLNKLNFTDETFVLGLEEIINVVKYIRSLNVPEEMFNIDLTIARGLDYYTGTVYETFLTEYREIGSVCSGGRYENLADYYTDKNLPGVGVSIGLTRLFYKLNELDIIKEKQNSIAKVLIIQMMEDKQKAMEIATQLRLNNINTQVFLENKKPKAVFKYADKLEIPYVIVIGEDEIANDNATLKNMMTGEQEVLKIEEIIEILEKD